MEQQYCAGCHFPTAETFYFCPNCGRKIHEPPVSTGVPKQLGIYLISVFLPPLGLWPGIRYVRQPNQNMRIIGTIAICLTVLSTIVTVWLTVGVMDMMQLTIEDQLQLYGGF